MGNSAPKRPIGKTPLNSICTSRTPGPLGKRDQADPDSVSLPGDTPQPTGMFGNLHGEAICRMSHGPTLLCESELSQADALIKAADLQTAASTSSGSTSGGAKVHYLVKAGIGKLRADAKSYKDGFPADYYDTFARHLFGIARDNHGGDAGEAFAELNQLQNGDFGSALRREYESVVGTDNTNGWDKVRHFIFTAYLQYKAGWIGAPELFAYGKELWDEAEQWVGQDPEGYSIPDIRADNRGEAFAEEIQRQEKRERQLKNAEELRKFKKVFIEQDRDWVLWFMQNFGR